MRRPNAVAGAMLVALSLAIAGDASAQLIFDHLECWKIKDPAPKKKYTATLTPEQTQFLTQTGCQVKVPAKLFCIDVEKSNVVPTAPAVLNGQNTRDFLCYKLKCPKIDMPLPVEDQFGTRTITVKKPAYLCAPARKVGFPDPPTPTPCLPPATPAPTSTPAAPTCTDLIQNGGETDVDCGGPCPPCPLGDGCAIDTDCVSGFCTGGVCTVCSPGQMQSCGTMLPGACAVGTQTCNGMGVYGPCVPPSGSPETCNNVDDDCDGSVDEGLGSSTCGVGNCQNTVPSCVGGMPQSCTPGMPTVETCNGMDDDCDGTTDEMNPGGGTPCSTGIPGICAAGTTNCVAGVIQCTQNSPAQPETCGNGLDDDCNGVIDNGCGLPNGSACTLASQCTSTQCVDGFCCNTSCSALCQACSAVKKGSGANGTCGFIATGTDPDSECPGTQTCSVGMCIP